jgi:hypothetical protein
MALSSTPRTSAGYLEDEKSAEALQHEIGTRPLKLPRTVIRAVRMFVACVAANSTGYGTFTTMLIAI